jgi:6-methylsalicylate decarboxylase
LVHLTEPPGPAVPGIPPFAADSLLDTTPAAFNLVRHDVPSRYPGIRFIFTHASGFVSCAAHRLALMAAEVTRRDLLQALDAFRSFHFDTALPSSPVILPSLLAFAKPGHMLYGSDWPYARPRRHPLQRPPEQLQALISNQRRDSTHGSAQQLFPRFA